MKKKMILLAAMACILLIGCASDGTGDTAEEQNEKKQEIQIYAGNSDSPIRTLDDPDDIEDFIRDLDIGNWERGSVPKDGTVSGQFVLMSEETRKLGQRKEDLGMEELCRLYLFEDSSCVRLELGPAELFSQFLEQSLSLDSTDSVADYVFQIPEESAETLQSYL